MTESSIHPSKDEARAALDSIRATQATIAEEMVMPRWYDTIYSGIAGVGVVGVALINAPSHRAATLVSGLALVLLMAAGFGWLYRAFRAANGFWISGVAPPRARWVAVASGVQCGVFIFFGSLAGSGGHWGLTAAAAIGAVLCSYALSLLWMRVYRAESGASR